MQLHISIPGVRQTCGRRKPNKRLRFSFLLCNCILCFSQDNIFIQQSVLNYLGQIIAAGFDGVYLDIIDAYEFYEDRGVDDASERMIEFVSDLAAYAREQKPGFMIVPQNAPELGANPAYLDIVDGIGMESVYFGYDEPGVATEPSTTADLELQLRRFTDAGKFVLAVDYVDTSSGVVSAYRRARLQGFLPTVTDVDLDGLPIPEPPP